MTTLKSRATVIKTETAKKANTALRVGALLEDMIDEYTITVGAETVTPDVSLRIKIGENYYRVDAELET